MSSHYCVLFVCLLLFLKFIQKHVFPPSLPLPTPCIQTFLLALTTGIMEDKLNSQFCRITVTDGYIANRSRRTRATNKLFLLCCPESVTCSLCLFTRTVQNHWDWVSRDFTRVSLSPLFSCESLHTLKLTRLGTFSHTGERSVGTRRWKCTSVVHTVEPRPPPRSLQSSLLSFADEIHWISRGKTGKVK